MFVAPYILDLIENVNLVDKMSLVLVNGNRMNFLANDWWKPNLIIH